MTEDQERLEKFIRNTISYPYFESLYDMDDWKKDKKWLEDLITSISTLDKMVLEGLKQNLKVHSETLYDCETGDEEYNCARLYLKTGDAYFNTFKDFAIRYGICKEDDLW